MRVWAEQGLCIKYINLPVIFPELCGIGVYVSEGPSDLKNQLLYSFYLKKKRCSVSFNRKNIIDEKR